MVGGWYVVDGVWWVVGGAGARTALDRLGRGGELLTHAEEVEPLLLKANQAGDMEGKRGVTKGRTGVQ